MSVEFSLKGQVTMRYSVSLKNKPLLAKRLTQKGIATVLVVLLVGIAMTATVLSTAAYLRSAQEQTMTTHAQLQAQMNAWTGAEVVREYLAKIQTASTLTTLAAAVNGASAGYLLTINGASGISATLTAVDSATNPTQFTAKIIGTTAAGTRAAATSTIQVVYAVSGSSSPGAIVPTLTFNQNLKLGGSITVTGSSTFTINVLGDLTTNGNSITGVNTINSTGSINIDSGSSYTTLNADCDIKITGSVTAVNANALRNICTEGAAAISGKAVANGAILGVASYGNNGILNAVNNSNAPTSCTAVGTGASGTSAATCDAPKYTVDLSAGSAGATTVNSGGTVNVSYGHVGTLNANGDVSLITATIDNLSTTGNLTVSSSGVVSAGTYGGTLTKPDWNSSIKATKAIVSAITITPAASVTLASSIFNAYDYESLANYIFQVNASGYTTVTVANVNGVAAGTYYLGNGPSGGQMDYLCKTLVSGTPTGSPVCSSTLVAKICKGYSDYNSCFSYNSATGWTINGTSMAPGVAFFSGNLIVGTGTYYNSFIATGNISTSGSDTVYAPNYAGYSGTVGGVTYAPTGICVNSYFSGLYPTQFCDATTSTYTSSSIGNYAFMAGSYIGTYSASTYVGGNVNLGASTKAYGVVKAGNQFESGGSTMISGSVSALALGTSVYNSLDGSTTFDLSKLPGTFDPGGGDSSSSGSGSASVSIQWARYL
jgi:hypothetical protein